MEVHEFEGVDVKGAIADEIIARYRDLGVYELRKDAGGDRHVIRHDRPAEVVAGADWLGLDETRSVREVVLASGIREGSLEDGFEERLVTFTASDETCDRYGDIILVDGTLDVDGAVRKFGKGWMTAEFLQNPVFLAFHSYSGIPLGNAVKTWTDQKGKRKRLRMTVLFNDGTSNPSAPFFLQAFKDGVMRACSVGFWPVKVYRPADDEERKKLKLGSYGVLFGEQTLWENSAVSVPANPNALADKSAQDLEDAGEQLDVDLLSRTLAFADQLRDVEPEYAYRVRSSIDVLALARKTFDVTAHLQKLKERTDPEGKAEPVAADPAVVVAPAGDARQVEPSEAVLPLAKAAELIAEAAGKVPPVPVVVHIDSARVGELVDKAAQELRDEGLDEVLRGFEQLRTDAGGAAPLDNEPPVGRVAPVADETAGAGALERMTALVDRIERAADRAEEAAAVIVGGGQTEAPDPYEKVLDVYDETLRAIRGEKG